MGKKRRRQRRSQQEKLDRQYTDWKGNPVTGAKSQAEADWIYQSGHEIENQLVTALQQGYQLHSTGWAHLVFPSDHGGLLPIALQSYAARNPDDETEYRGWEFKSNGYVVRIKPSRAWLESVKDTLSRQKFLEMD